MWYVIIGMGTFMMCLLISLLCLRSEVELIKNNRCTVSSGCEEYIDSVMKEHDYLSCYEYRHINKAHESSGELRAMQRIGNDLDRQIRLNAIFCSLDREITIKEALQMLFSYLKLMIKHGDDVKIVKIK